MQIIKYALVFIIYICFGFSYFLAIGAFVSSVNGFEKDSNDCLKWVIILWLIVGICMVVIEKI